MAPRSPELQIPEVEMACTLLKKFCRDHNLTATGTAFEIDLKRKRWNTRKTSALAKIGIPSLEKLLTSHTQQKSPESGDDSNISDSSSLTSVPEHELGSDFPQQCQAQCQWIKCTKKFPTTQQLLVSQPNTPKIWCASNRVPQTHVSDDHVGRRKSDNYTLSCGWKGCGYDAAKKRNHLVSHLQTHIIYKPYRCNDCGVDFARVRDKNKHLASRKHQERAVEVKPLHGSSGTLKRKAPEEIPEAETSETPAKRTKVKQSHQLDGAYSSTSSASSSLDSSSSSNSVSSTQSSSSDSDSEVVVKKAKKQDIMVDAEVSSSATSSPSGEDTSSSGDSSDSDSDASTSSSDESESNVSISSTREVAESKLPKQDDQAASNSSGTLLGDQKTSPGFASSEDTPQERIPIKAMANIKKHLGARQTPLAQLSATATPDSHISNAYISYDYAERAYNDLSVTRGKGFTKEKNKKKRGSYRGGAIDISGGKSFKFDD